jgi:hypothetical protein
MNTAAMEGSSTTTKHTYVCRLCGANAVVEELLTPALIVYRVGETSSFVVPEGWRLITMPDGAILDARLICGECNSLIVADGAGKLVAELRAELARVKAERDDLLRACHVAAFWSVELHGEPWFQSVLAMQMLLRGVIERVGKKEG